MDERHAHQVFAGVRPGAKPMFVVKESAYQNDDAEEVVVQEMPLEAPWEAQLFHWQLECRLAILGRYWRHDANEPGWRPLVAPQGLPELDLREVAVSPFLGRLVVHHFHKRGTKEERVLLAIPNATPHGRRHLLALAAYDTGAVEEARIELLHAHLPDAPAQSLLVREHLRLREQGFEKLAVAHEFLRALGAEWPQAVGAAYTEVLRRISEGRYGAVRHAREVPVDDLYTDYLGALTDPRLLALQARFLTPEEQDAALAGGAPAIGKLISAKRAAALPDDQHRLTLLEASLLARHQLRPGSRARVDPEVSALVRRFAYYL